MVYDPDVVDALLAKMRVIVQRIAALNASLPEGDRTLH